MLERTPVESQSGVSLTALAKESGNTLTKMINNQLDLEYESLKLERDQLKEKLLEIEYRMDLLILCHQIDQR